ncbi:glycosyltransferase family A protein [Citromicrobium bathyomarinum]|uniref:glycosyltransferase family 2 protein n=1 Tax=Citromicrobium bathyomarinum TaxID=72174 RepID=UPI00315AF3F1
MPDSPAETQPAPLVSIIMPAYNAAEFLAEAIRSILSQTHRRWQLIIVDDGSTDATFDIASAFDDPRIEVIRQDNAGASAARNTALRHARGDLITFVDADDILPEAALTFRVNFLCDNPQIDIASGPIRVTRNGEEVRLYRPSSKVQPFFRPLLRLDESVFFGPFYMVRAEAITGLEFDTSTTHCEDIIFFLSAAHDRDLVHGAVTEPVYEYRLHGGSAMSNLAGISRGYFFLLDHAHRMARAQPADLRHLRHRIASILGKSWLRAGRPLMALRCIAKALTFTAARPGGHAKQ